MYNTKVIHQILVRMKESPNNRKKAHGICHNLKHYYVYFADTDVEHANYEVSEFLFECFTNLFGAYEPYPIEKEQRVYDKIEDKWKEGTKFGDARHALLDEMIKYCNNKLEKRNE